MPSQASSVSWVSRGNARYTTRNVASSRFGSRFSVRVLRWGERVISWSRDLLGMRSPSRSSRVWSRLVVRGSMKRTSDRSQSLSDRSWRLGEPLRNEDRLACSKDKYQKRACLKLGLMNPVKSIGCLPYPLRVRSSRLGIVARKVGRPASTSSMYVSRTLSPRRLRPISQSIESWATTPGITSRSRDG
uniref:(northern house mosquito) hypothetical protein n=1 Tax=Culex pipiens TaxID=7175 RepID=A0A8D8A8J2_CULPI